MSLHFSHKFCQSWAWDALQSCEKNPSCSDPSGTTGASRSRKMAPCHPTASSRDRPETSWEVRAHVKSNIVARSNPKAVGNRSTSRTPVSPLPPSFQVNNFATEARGQASGLSPAFPWTTVGDLVLQAHTYGMLLLFMAPGRRSTSVLSYSGSEGLEGRVCDWHLFFLANGRERVVHSWLYHGYIKRTPLG